MKKRTLEIHAEIVEKAFSKFPRRVWSKTVDDDGNFVLPWNDIKFIELDKEEYQYLQTLEEDTIKVLIDEIKVNWEAQRPGFEVRFGLEHYPWYKTNGGETTYWMKLTHIEFSFDRIKKVLYERRRGTVR